MKSKNLQLVRNWRALRLLLVLAAVIGSSEASSQISSKPCATPGSVPLPNGMVAWWPLDETLGSTVVDRIGGDNNGTAIPAAIGAGGPVSVMGDFVGNSLSFYSGKYVQVQPAANLDFGPGNFSIDAWVKFSIEQYSQTEPIVRKLGPNSGYSLYIEENSTLNVFYLKLRIGTAVYKGPMIPTVHVGKWIFVAATRNGSTVRLYVGIPSTPTPFNAQQTLGPIQNATSSGTPLIIGPLPSNTNPSSSYIDEVEIFKVAVPEADLMKVFNAGKKGKCKKSADPT